MRTGILVSGRGSNMEALIRARTEKRVTGYDVVVVATENPLAPAIEKAQKLHVPVEVVDRKAFNSRKGFERRLIDVLETYGVELVVLAGFMRILGPDFLQRFEGRILNIHPSLLPAFPGLDAQTQAWDYGVKVSGLTIHFVDQGVDTGPIIFQYPVPVLETDTSQSLAQRILEYEHKFYPQIVDIVARGMYVIEGRWVRLLEKVPGGFRGC